VCPSTLEAAERSCSCGLWLAVARPKQPKETGELLENNTGARSYAISPGGGRMPPTGRHMNGAAGRGRMCPTTKLIEMDSGSNTDFSAPEPW